MLSDVMKLTKYPLIIVTSATLGSINSAVLTALYAKSLKLEVLGFIINYFDKDNIIHQDNYKMIEKLSGYKVLGYLEKMVMKLRGLYENNDRICKEQNIK